MPSENVLKEAIPSTVALIIKHFRGKINKGSEKLNTLKTTMHCWKKLKT